MIYTFQFPNSCLIYVQISGDSSYMFIHNVSNSEYNLTIIHYYSVLNTYANLWIVKYELIYALLQLSTIFLQFSYVYGSRFICELNICQLCTSCIS